MWKRAKNNGEDEDPKELLSKNPILQKNKQRPRNVCHDYKAKEPQSHTWSWDRLTNMFSCPQSSQGVPIHAEMQGEERDLVDAQHLTPTQTCQSSVDHSRGGWLETTKPQPVALVPEHASAAFCLLKLCRLRRQGSPSILRWQEDFINDI